MFVGAVLSVLIALQMVDRRDGTKRYLLAFMLTATLFQASHFVFFNYLKEVVPLFDSLFSYTLPAQFVLFYFYIHSLTTSCSISLRKWLLLIPSVLCLVVVVGLYVAMDSAERSLFVNQFLYDNVQDSLSGLPLIQEIVHRGVMLVFMLQTVPIAYITFQRIKSYNAMLLAHYSNTEDKKVKFVYPPFLFLFFVFIVSLFCLFVEHLVFLDHPWLVYLISIVYACILLELGGHGLARNFFFHDMEQEEAQEDDEAEVDVPVEMDGTQLKQRVLHAVKKEQLFLQPNLKISDLARYLHTNRNYIYNVVNVEMGLSFSELVNRERVEYAVALMKEYPDMLLGDIAVKSGFSSNVSFYRNFKKFKGLSPKEYLQQLGKD